MAETFGFFDAEELVDGTFDREYVAEQWANYFKLFIGNGVFVSPMNQLKVVAASGLGVQISPGYAWINGYWYRVEGNVALEIPPNVTATKQKHGVFIRWDSVNREIKAIVGENRTTVNRISPYYELKIAEVTVPVSATAVTDANIKDTRPDSSVCGFVTGIVDVIDSSDLFLQYQTIFNEFMEHIAGQLDEDIAGHLQDEIDDIKREIGAPSVYDPTQSYVVGSYVLHENSMLEVRLYKCISPTTGEFNPAKWQETTIFYELTHLSLTPKSIGALATNGDGKNVTVTFTTKDAVATTTEQTNHSTDKPSTVVKLNSGETLATMFGKISAMFKNVRRLWNTVGSTAIDTAYGATITAQMANLKSYNTYSTSETWTGKYWIDGKKIYQKTWDFFHPNTNNDTTDAFIDISSLSVDKVLDLRGIYNDPQYGSWMPAPSARGSSAGGNFTDGLLISCIANNSALKIRIRPGSGSYFKKANTYIYIHIEYTKITN